jgi:hypothetical protein
VRSVGSSQCLRRPVLTYRSTKAANVVLGYPYNVNVELEAAQIK